MTPDRSHSDTVGCVTNKVRVRPLQPLFLRSEYVPKYRSSDALPAPEIFLSDFRWERIREIPLIFEITNYNHIFVKINKDKLIISRNMTFIIPHGYTKKTRKIYLWDRSCIIFANFCPPPRAKTIILRNFVEFARKIYVIFYVFEF